MIIQKIIFPKKEICPQKSLYLRELGGTKYDFEDNTLKFVKHSRVKFDTYYNSFSLTKWKRYTRIQNLVISLKCKGRFIIQIFHTTVENSKETKLLFSDYFEDKASIPIDINKAFGVLHFNLECLSDEGEFISGTYQTTTRPAYDVKICMAVCTYRREEYILRNLNQITKTILENKKSKWKDKFDVIVSDNGNTLPIDGHNEHIKIVYNKNTGGAGGFTRCMMEMLKVKDVEKYTHILLTDDDIILEPAVIERLFALLSYLKTGYRESFVGGSMFRTDNMTMQNELANRWEKGNVVALKHNVPMDSFTNVINNEKLDVINYFSWWFCCMPADVVNKDNLPLPLFIKRDDIEYGLRNGASFITINGINVWHEPFEGKRPAYLEYYYIRNQLVMESTMRKNPSAASLIKKVRKRLMDDVSRFHYLEFKFFCKGILDYCKGIDFFKGIDAVQLNTDLRAMDRKTYPVSELPIEFNDTKYKNSFIYRESKRRLYFRRLTLNGWLLPSKKSPAIVQSAFPKKLPFYRVNTALNVETISKTGYISHKSWRELFECYKLSKQVEKEINKYYRYAVAEFVNRWHELTNLDFWEHYLFEEITPSEKVHPLLVFEDPEEKLDRQTYYVDALRTKKINEHIVYLESRKSTDFASNIFAIAKELMKPEYKRFKVYLSYTPEAKDLILGKIKENNLHKIILVERESKEFLDVMATAKYFFTDFHLFPQFVKREGQVVVSLWHGTPLKTLGKDCKSETQASVQRIFYIADYQVYPGKFMRDKMLDIYWLENIYQGKILETGYPRNALFFDEERRKQIRQKLNIDDKQVIMYMPTFRGAAGNNKNLEQSQIIANYFDEIDAKLNDNQIFYIKLHNYNTAGIDCSKYKHIKEAPSQFDNYELQNACDLLITDYSSVFFDFAVSRRKIILFQYDQEDYLTNRGICIPLKELPFPIVTNVKGLIKEINSPIKYNDKKFLEKYATYDNKDATKFLCHHVILKEELPAEYHETTATPNGKKNIFIFTNSLRTRHSALPFWDNVNSLDFDKANYFLLYFDPVMWKNAFRLLPMDPKCNQIGMWSYTSYTRDEKKAHDDYINNHVINDEIKAILNRMYQRELIKHFGGQVKADAIVFFDCIEPNLYNMYSTFTDNKFAFFSPSIKIGDKSLIDSLSTYKQLPQGTFKETLDKFASGELEETI